MLERVLFPVNLKQEQRENKKKRMIIKKCWAALTVVQGPRNYEFSILQLWMSLYGRINWNVPLNGQKMQQLTDTAKVNTHNLSHTHTLNTVLNKFQTVSHTQIWTQQNLNVTENVTETVAIFLEGEDGLRNRQGWLKHYKEEDERFVFQGVGEKNASSAEQPLPGKIKTCYCWLYKKPNNRDTNFSFSSSFMFHFITECCTQKFASCSPFMLHKKIILWWSAEDKLESLTAWG